MTNSVNIWNTNNLPVTIEVNGYTVTLERKEHQSVKGAQTYFFGSILTPDGNTIAIDKKPIVWVKTKVGDSNRRTYSRCSDGLRVRKVQSPEEIDSSVNTYRAKCERILEDLRKITANGYTDGAIMPEWWHTMVSAANIAISEATAVYRCQLEDYNREQQEKAIAHAEQSKIRALSAELQRSAKAGNFVKVSQIAQELAQM